MSGNLVVQHPDLAEQAKQIPAGCDFFKELAALHKPLAEAATEAFRQDWVAKYESGEIKIVNKIRTANDTKVFRNQEGCDSDACSVFVSNGAFDVVNCSRVASLLWLRFLLMV